MEARTLGLLYPVDPVVGEQNFPQFVVIHTVKGFGIVNKAEVDVFLEVSCFFHDPADVGNLISGSSAFSKTSLNISGGIKIRSGYCDMGASLSPTQFLLIL